MKQKKQPQSKKDSKNSHKCQATIEVPPQLKRAHKQSVDVVVADLELAKTITKNRTLTKPDKNTKS